VLDSVADGVKMMQTDSYFPNLLSAIKWADVLVLPRRYAGLCLPALEAMADGCPVIMTDAPPQNGWPIIGCCYSLGDGIKLAGGWIPTYEAEVGHLAYLLEELSAEPTPVTVHRSEMVRLWSESRSWAGELGDEWHARLRCSLS
jgi:glycosyltransferase involved in cell wall biosynthesis